LYILLFSLFKHYFFLKYQPSAAKRQIISGVDIHTCLHHDFLNLPLKSSLKGWHRQWFYCEDHEPNLPPFIGHLSKYDAMWVKEPVESEMAIVTALASQVSELKGLSLTRVSVAAHWLAHRVASLKKQVHPGWKYYGVQDPTQELGDNIEANKLVELLQEVFQSTNNYRLLSR
jgi:hypothetical protein